MHLHVICGYPSKSQGTYTEFDRADFDAYKFVKAVKHADFKGFAVISQNGTQYRFEDDASGRATALNIAARSLAGLIYSRLGLKSAVVVPVPASNHVNVRGSFTGSRLAEAIQHVHTPFQAAPCLTFDQVMKKAAEGGPRDPAELLPHLRFHGPIPDGPVVLIDDVTSTHGHLKAAARCLRQNGRNVAGACCVAQTVWERPEKMFSIPARELNIDTWPHDLPDPF